MDDISSLPTTNENPSQEDLDIVKGIFSSSDDIKTGKSILKHFKLTLIIGLLFIFFSLPISNKLVNLIFSSSKNNEFLLMTIKTVLFMFLFYIISNWNKIKKD